MNGLVLQTATSVPTTAVTGLMSRSTTTLRWWEGIHTHNPHTRPRSFPHSHRTENIKILSPGLFQCLARLAAPLNEDSFFYSSMYQLRLCIPFSAHLFSPKQPYVYSGSLALAGGRFLRLAVGLISIACLSLDRRTHTHPGDGRLRWRCVRTPGTARA